MSVVAPAVNAPRARATPSSPLPPLLPTRLSEVAQARPDHPALEAGGMVTAYGVLWSRITALGEVLRSRIRPGDRVALALDNGAEYVVGLYAIWHAGGVAVGLNTALKSDDLVHLAQRCGASLVLADGDGPHSAFGTALAAAGLPVWPTATWPAQLPADAPEPRPRVLRPDQGAVLIFTSGTTGEPKGALLTHGALAANVAAVQQVLPMQADDVTLCVLPFHYAFGGSVLHTHLTLGATLVLENSFMYPQQVMQRMVQRQVTAFYGVPSSYYLLLARGHLAHAPLPSLRYAAQAGGPMEPARIDEVCAAWPQASFWVMYGQTEACSRLTILPASVRQRKAGSVGLPLPGVRLRILDPLGQPLPAGATGEVCAQGPNLMQGYWDAPQDTAATLRDGWLHTGDLGHLDDDGFLFLQGRLREIIKVGAHRVAPLEIERVIQSVPGVRECAVVAQPDPLLGEAVRACVVHHPGVMPDVLRRDILRTCREQLALYKLPKHIDFVDDFPRTASGKVQKHRLPPASHTPQVPTPPPPSGQAA